MRGSRMVRASIGILIAEGLRLVALLTALYETGQSEIMGAVTSIYASVRCCFPSHRQDPISSKAYP